MFSEVNSVAYINVNNFSYPLTDQDIRTSSRTVSLPSDLTDEVLSQNGFALVIESEKPAPKIYQTVTEDAPKKVSGKWRQQWKVNTPPLAVCKQIVLRDINRKCDMLLAQVKTGYPQGEVESWAKQEAEAKAYLADSSSPAPLISAIAAARGIQVSDLANRIMLKSNAYAAAVGAIIGLRQALETDLDDSDDETIDLVVWPD